MVEPKAELSSPSAVVEPKNGTSPQGMIRHFDTNWTVTFTLDVVKPVGFDELKKLVANAIQSAGPQVMRDLFQEWATQLKKYNLIDETSFAEARAVYEQQQAAKKPN